MLAQAEARATVWRGDGARAWRAAGRGRRAAAAAKPSPAAAAAAAAAAVPAAAAAAAAAAGGGAVMERPASRGGSSVNGRAGPTFVSNRGGSVHGLGTARDLGRTRAARDSPLALPKECHAWWHDSLATRPPSLKNLLAYLLNTCKILGGFPCASAARVRLFPPRTRAAGDPGVVHWDSHGARHHTRRGAPRCSHTRRRARDTLRRPVAHVEGARLARGASRWRPRLGRRGSWRASCPPGTEHRPLPAPSLCSDGRWCDCGAAQREVFARRAEFRAGGQRRCSRVCRGGARAACAATAIVRAHARGAPGREHKPAWPPGVQRASLSSLAAASS